MASKWVHTRIGQVAHRVTKGTTPTTIGGQFTEGGIAFVKAESITDDGRIDETKVAHIDDVTNKLLSRSVLNEEDILFTIAGTIGRVAMVSCAVLPANTNQAVAIIRPNRSVIEPRYLYYALRDRQRVRRALTRVVQSVQANLSLAELSETEIPLPSKQEQRAIAHILGALDDKIELNRRMNQTLEAMAQALFKSWFVDFEPFRDQGVQDSPLGVIPVGWHTGRLGDSVQFLGGYAFKSNDWIEQGVPVVKIGSVKPGIVDLSEVSFVSNEVAEEAKRFRLSPADLLIGMTGYVGEVGLLPPTDNPPLLNQRVGKFVLEKEGTEALAFTYCLTRRPDFKAAVETSAHGTAQANVSAEGILSIPVVVPPKLVRDAFNRLCQPVFDRILCNHSESQILASIREALLPKLLSGELRPRDADRLREERV